MMNEIIMENAWHTTKDMAAMLGIETVTVRKYALALEKAGYIISRDDKDRRTYSDVDAMALQQLFTLRERSGMTVEKSAEMVASRFLAEQASSPAPVAAAAETLPAAPSSSLLDEVFARMNELIAMNKDLSDRVTEQQNKMEGALQNRDERITQILMELRETKRAIATAKEKKSVWKRLFGLY